MPQPTTRIIERERNPDAREGDHGTALQGIAQGEAAQSMQWAADHPRDIERVLETVEAMAVEAEVENQDEKAYCFYSLPRDGKTIIGPSIRLAEIIIQTMPNVAVGSRPIETTDKTVIAQGVARDWERNTTVFIETTRPILTKHGKRFGHSMIETTMKAAAACARRDAIFSLVPKSRINHIVNKCREVARRGKGQKPGEEIAKRRTTMMEYFGRVGVTTDDILRYLGLSTVEDITHANLDDLKGLATAIRDGEAEIDEVFHVEHTPPAPAGGRDPLIPEPTDEELKASQKGTKKLIDDLNNTGEDQSDD